MTDSTTTPDTTDTDLTPNDRRALLRKIAIGGAGAAAGAVLLSQGRASAADTANLVIGSAAANEGDTPTFLTYNDASPKLTEFSVLSVGEDRPNATDKNNVFPAAVGGYGKGDVPSGLHGSTINAEGFGVVAANLGPNPDGSTTPTTKALAIASTGAHVLFLAGAKTGPANGTHVAGELYVDADGTLWFTVPTATAGTVRFVKLAGTPAAGSFHAINPQRVYDSRQPGYPAALRGVMAPNTNRVISVADGRSADGTTVTLANAVPALPTRATAVQINVTAANMTGPNFLSVTAGDVTTTTTSLLNWGPGDIQIANSITVPIDAEREIRVYNGNQTGSTDVIIDVFGYYL